MEISINNKTIKSTTINPFEEAWNIEDTLSLLEYYRHNNIIILGGDILNTNFKHTYDSWFYNPDTSQNSVSNSNSSIQKATKYITQYLNNNGNKYYVVFVVENWNHIDY